MTTLAWSTPDVVSQAMAHKTKKFKAGIKAKVKRLFRVIKRQLGHKKVRYRSLQENTVQLAKLLALFKLWMVHSKLMKSGCECARNRVRVLQRLKSVKNCITNKQISGFFL